MEYLNIRKLRDFKNNGFVIFKNFLGEDLCRAIIEIANNDLERLIPPVELERQVGYKGAPISDSFFGAKTARRLLQAYSRDSSIKRWALSNKVKNPLSGMLGGRPMLSLDHHNCIMTKLPGFSSITEWHQDIRYWHFKRPELISVWSALGRENVRNGCLWVVPGSHKRRFDWGQFDSKKFFKKTLKTNHNILAGSVPVFLNRGDVLFFHCRLLHSAGRNQTLAPKYSLVFTYHLEDNKPILGTKSATQLSVPL